MPFPIPTVFLRVNGRARDATRDHATTRPRERRGASTEFAIDCSHRQGSGGSAVEAASLHLVQHSAAQCSNGAIDGKPRSRVTRHSEMVTRPAEKSKDSAAVHEQLSPSCSLAALAAARPFLARLHVAWPHPADRRSSTTEPFKADRHQSTINPPKLIATCPP